jgi:hypothetical protein
LTHTYTQLAILKSTVEAAKADLDLLNTEVCKFEASRIRDDTSVSEVQDRFPAAAKVVEGEIKKHEWFKEVHH